MILRPYQTEIVDGLWHWFTRHGDGNPIVVAAVGAGKSLMIAAVAKRADAEFPGTRILVIVHQKELLVQNVDKIRRIWPEGNVGIYSASLNSKQLGAQITYATIGSIYKRAHQLGRIDIVMADECHLINPKQEGMWRSFLTDLAKYNPHTRTIGWTGTEYRGNGVFLTANDTALFTHVAAKVTMRNLLDLGFLAPLTPAQTVAKADTSEVATSGDDYVVSGLAAVTDTVELVEATASEICMLFSDRKRWLVFAVTIKHAEHICASLYGRGIKADIVSAETPAAERDEMIRRFRDGRLRCLVNVAVLTTGFDVPEIDAIAMLRATKSPVLYVQIAGRGMRLADGKTDCLWADFTDTTLRLGPVDAVKGRLATRGGKQEAPFRLCPECGSRNIAAATECLDCGHQFPPKEVIKHGDKARGAAVLSDQLPREQLVQISGVTYHEHLGQQSGLMSMRVDYWSGLEVVCSEWVMLNASGYNRVRSETWWRHRALQPGIPRDVATGVAAANDGRIRAPIALKLSVERKKKPEIISFIWEK